MMYHNLTGLGDCTGGYDEFGMACTDFTPITSNPAATAGAIDYLYNPYPVTSSTTGQPTSGSPSAGFNWGIFAPLINAAGAIGGGFAAGQLKPGQSLQTAGTTITGAGLALPGSVAGGLNLSSLTMPLLIGGGLLIVVMVMSGGRK